MSMWLFASIPKPYQTSTTQSSINRVTSVYLSSTRYITRFAIAGSRFKDLGEGIACHRDEPRVGLAVVWDSRDAHVESPSLATVERCLVRIDGSEERVSAGLVEQPPRCGRSIWVPEVLTYYYPMGSQRRIGPCEPGVKSPCFRRGAKCDRLRGH
jgi:hypothetical protein